MYGGKDYTQSDSRAAVVATQGWGRGLTRLTLSQEWFPSGQGETYLEVGEGRQCYLKIK